MNSPLGFKARQCDPISNSALDSTYQAPYPPAPLHKDNSRTMPRHKSLPSINSTMYSESSPKRNIRGINKSDSTYSLRKSVSGMKCLLPLKLSSSRPTSTSNSATPPQRPTIGFEEHGVEESILQTPHQSPKQRFQVPRPMTIRREQYRDTPIYTEPGSPLLNLAYYTDEEVCMNSFPADSYDESSNIHGHASSSSESKASEDLDEETPLPQGPSPSRRNRSSRSSNLSFQCLGGSEGLRKPLFREEGAWLSSPLNKWNNLKAECLPQLLAENMPVEHDIEGWLSDTSSICGDDSYAYATTLTPTRANVVDVNTRPPPIKIPPRSSSLVGTRSQSLTPAGGRKSPLALGDSCGDIDDQFDPWSEDGVFTKSWISQPSLPKNSTDLAMMSPPLSPTRLGPSRSRIPMNLRRGSDPNNYDKELTPSAASDSVFQIISDLEHSTSNFPSSTLLPDTPCISAIRTQLQHSSHSQWNHHAPQPSPFSEGVDWRPLPDSSLYRPKTSYITSLQRTFSSRTSKTVPVSKQGWDEGRRGVFDTPLHSQQQPPCTFIKPNLQPLTAIFPYAPYNLHATLYAHILAYIFLTSLSGHLPLPTTHTPPLSPPYMPFFTTSQSLPSKAADRLGIAISADLTRRINVGDDAIILRRSRTIFGVEILLERMRQCIGSLIYVMDENGHGTEIRGKEVDGAFLRALVEVVKGCECACFSLS